MATSIYPTIETRTTRPVYIEGASYVGIVGVGEPGLFTLSRRVKFTRLSKGGYSVRSLGPGGRYMRLSGDSMVLVDGMAPFTVKSLFS